MNIKLKNFGQTLTSRQSGKESYAAFLSTLESLPKDETISVDFDGINTFSPSWGDEFLTSLMKRYNNQVSLMNTQNLSVQTTIQLLEEINGYKFTTKKN